MADKDSPWRGHTPSPLQRPEGQPPVSPGPDGGWLMELASGPGGRIELSYERVGGIVRIHGSVVLRHPRGNVVQPVTIVMREEDARDLGPSLMGILGS